MLRKICLIIAGLLLSLVAGLGWAVHNFDYERLKAPLADALTNATGFKFEIDDIGYGLAPLPTLVINKVRAANQPWATHPHIVDIERIVVRPDLRAASRGQLKPHHVLIETLTLNLETDYHGNPNWQRENANAAEMTNLAALPLPAEITLTNANLRFNSGWALTEQTHPLHRLSIVADETTQNLQIAGETISGKHAISFEGTVGQLESFVQNTPAEIDLKGAYGAAQMTLEGTIDRPGTIGGVDLDFVLTAESLNDFGPIDAGNLGVYDLPKDQKVKLTAHATSNEQGPYIDDFLLKVGGFIFR
ncbi:MAG: AsmA family protein [Pseudomonadota bacterium]